MMADETAGSEAMLSVDLLIRHLPAFGTLSLDVLATGEVCFSLV
jgi:hypothetical protein